MFLEVLDTHEFNEYSDYQNLEELFQQKTK